MMGIPENMGHELPLIMFVSFLCQDHPGILWLFSLFAMKDVRLFMATIGSELLQSELHGQPSQIVRKINNV